MAPYGWEAFRKHLRLYLQIYSREAWFLLPTAIRSHMSLSQQRRLLKFKLLEKEAHLELLGDIVRHLLQIHSSTPILLWPCF